MLSRKSLLENLTEIKNSLFELVMELQITFISLLAVTETVNVMRLVKHNDMVCSV